MKTDFIKRTYIDETLHVKHDFESIVQNNSLSVILGEPASGKTEQLQEYKKLNPENCEFIELLDIENEDDISENIELVLLLDSIDEALSRNDSDKILKNKLSRYIKNCKKINPDVKIIITCRGADWKEAFEGKLKEIDEEFKIFHIVDLTPAEINILLEQKGINQAEFWSFIEDNYLEQLLKNIMLILHLMDNFESYKGKTLKYFEIYEEIIKEHILPKTNNERNKLFAKSSLEEILLISSSLAAYMTLNRKRVINIEDINRLADSLYKIGNIEITGEKLNLVFDTALLRGTRKNMRYFHKSIQEYLCAYYINKRQFDIETIKEIFAHKEGFYEEFEEVINLDPTLVLKILQLQMFTIIFIKLNI